MAATEDVDIVNLALGHLGRSPLADLDGTDEATVAANLFLNQAREDLLRGFAWQFATAEIELEESAEEASVDWDYVYDYPEDIVRIVRLRNATNRYKSAPYKLNSNVDGDAKVIYTDLDEAVAICILNLTDVTLYPTDFVLALSWYLALLMAPMLRNDTKTIQKLTAGYALALSKAKAGDGNEQWKDPEEAEENPYGDARG